MLEKLQNIDRRIVYLLILLAIALPLLKPVGLPFSMSNITHDFYDSVEALEPCSVVAVAIDYSAGASPQIHPQARAVLKHLMYKQDMKIVFVSIATTGPMFTNQLLDEVAGHDMIYGEDYVHLGYLPGAETAISAMSMDFHKAYPKDQYGTSIAEIPMMADIKSANDLDMFLVFTATEPSQYVRQVADAYDVPLAFGVNSVIIPTNMPYYNSGQIFGLLDGLRGAAEYEVVSGKPGSATASMDALSATHTVILAFMVLGNIAYFIGKGKGGK